MKGVSTVIATLMMLIITISLAGLAYTYLTGTFSGLTGKGVELISANCVAGSTTYTLILKSLDQNAAIQSSEVTVLVNNQLANKVSSPTLPAGGAPQTWTVTATSAPTAGSVNNVKIVGPSGESQKPAAC